MNNPTHLVVPDVAGDPGGELSFEVALGALDLGPELQSGNTGTEKNNKQERKSTQFKFYSTGNSV